MSAVLNRPKGAFDTALVVYDSSGKVIASNDDSFQDPDSTILDLTLPTTGTYYVMVTSSPKSVADHEPLTGAYELFMYTFATGGIAPAGFDAAGDTMYAGSASDTIVAGTGNDAIAAQLPIDTVIYGSGNVDLFAKAPYLDVSAAAGGPAFVGDAVTLTGSFIDPNDADVQTYAWHVDASNGQMIADGAGASFTFTPEGVGTYTVSLTITDQNGGVVQTSVQVAPTVAPLQLTPPAATGQSVSEGMSTNFDLGQIDTPEPGPFTVNVAWGDGQTSTFTEPMVGAIVYAHAYAYEGSYSISETVTDNAGTATALSLSSPVVVVDQPVVVTPVTSLAANLGSPTGNIVVATFTDPGGDDRVSDFMATVIYGDPNEATNNIVYDSTTRIFSVEASFTFDQMGNIPITVTVSHDGSQLVTESTSVYVSSARTSALLVAPSSVVYGSAATLTATVTGYGAPTGNVTFFALEGSSEVPLGTGPLSFANGEYVAAISTSSLIVSNFPYTITAVYSGDANNEGSTSDPATLAITPAALAITANNQTKVYGQANPTLTFSYSGFVNGESASSLTTLPSATTTATTTSPVGSYTISAAGAVDPNYSFTYVAGSLTINKDATTTNATVSTTSGSMGQTVTITASISANAPGSGTPTGSVDFLDTTTNVDLGSVGLSDGAASLSTTALSTGSHEIKVTYSGDSNFVTSRTTTSAITIGQSLIVLDPTAGGALSISGNASIKLSGGVYVDSSSSSAILASGNAAIIAAVIDVHGGVSKSGNASFSPAAVTKAAVVNDPLSGLAVPSETGLTKFGSYSLSGNSSGTIKSGIYSVINVSGNASLTMSPGIYIITGGGFSVSGNASVTGTGVTIYNANSTFPSSGGTTGAISLSGNGTFKLTPATTGTYANLLFIQPAANTHVLTYSGNAMAGVSGTIYSPSAGLVESGNAQLNASIIVDTITLSGNAIANVATLTAPQGAVAYSPAQVRSAYGVSSLTSYGSGQTIAIIDAYDNPDIFPAIDAFDTQFGLTDSGPSLYDQYGPASSFLTVIGQNGQATALPASDPNGPGTDNWEVEESLDVEWAHAIAPGAKIILVEANSQSLSDLMAAVATAAAQPGVSVVSMSWGFAEGQSVSVSDEATYDAVLEVPGVSFVASTGDHGAADPEYPAYSPNVVAVGGTTLDLNTLGDYDHEHGWGNVSGSQGTAVGSGGGISQFEAEPSYQQGVQTTGGRTTPDVSLVADPATGAWIADPYNLADSSSPFEVVGGTSLSAPAWAGLLALVNQGREAARQPVFNSTSPTEVQQALYSLPQSDYNVITSGNNGYDAASGYNLVTGLGTPIANLLVSDLVVYQDAGTTYSGEKVGPLQDATPDGQATGAGTETDVINVFDSITVTSASLGSSAAEGAIGRPISPQQPTSPTVASDHSARASSNATILIFAPFADQAVPPSLTTMAAAVLPQSASAGGTANGLVTWRASDRPAQPSRAESRQAETDADTDLFSPANEASRSLEAIVHELASGLVVRSATRAERSGDTKSVAISRLGSAPSGTTIRPIWQRRASFTSGGPAGRLGPQSIGRAARSRAVRAVPRRGAQCFWNAAVERAR